MGLPAPGRINRSREIAPRSTFLNKIDLGAYHRNLEPSGTIHLIGFDDTTNDECITCSIDGTTFFSLLWCSQRHKQNKWPIEKLSPDSKKVQVHGHSSKHAWRHYDRHAGCICRAVENAYARGDPLNYIATHMIYICLSVDGPIAITLILAALNLAERLKQSMAPLLIAKNERKVELTCSAKGSINYSHYAVVVVLWWYFSVGSVMWTLILIIVISLYMALTRESDEETGRPYYCCCLRTVKARRKSRHIIA